MTPITLAINAVAVAVVQRCLLMCADRALDASGASSSEPQRRRRAARIRVTPREAEMKPDKCQWCCELCAGHNGHDEGFSEPAQHTAANARYMGPLLHS